jgi:hypothetical protein
MTRLSFSSALAFTINCPNLRDLYLQNKYPLLAFSMFLFDVPNRLHRRGYDTLAKFEKTTKIENANAITL